MVEIYIQTINSLFHQLLFPSVFLTDLVLYCEAFLTTYRTFITPEDLIKKLHYRYPFAGREAVGHRPTKKNVCSLRLCPAQSQVAECRNITAPEFRFLCFGKDHHQRPPPDRLHMEGEP